MVADEARERESDVLREGYLQGCVWKLGDVLDLSCWQEGGLWGRGGGEAAPRMLSVALVMWRELGRGRGHTPRVTLRNIGGGHCEELLLRQKHSGHVVAEAHL